MNDWAVGLSTGCFYQQNILTCLETIQAGGFNLLEICSSPQHLDFRDAAAVERAAREIEVRGLSAYSFHAPFADRIDITSLEEDRRRDSVEEVLAAVEAAADLGCRNFVIHPGPENQPVFSGEERMRRFELVVESLERVAERCARHRLNCVLENKLPHLLFGNTADMLWILGKIEAPNVGVCLDTGHAHLGRELDTATHKLSRHLRMLHAHDNRGHADEHLAPGLGEIGWPRLLEVLSLNDFRGAIILELAGRGEPAEILRNARAGQRFLRRTAWEVAWKMQLALASAAPLTRPYSP